MKTHRLQLKLRVAALLAVLHGEESVTIDWWRMADWVVSRSDEGLMVCRYFALQERMKEAKTRGRREGLVAAESSKVVEEEAGRSFSSAKRIVLNRLERADGRWVKAKELQVALGKPEYRKHEKEVVSDLLESGDIEKSRRRTPGKPGPAGLWYRRVMP
jgi:hypothetical protein